MTIVNYIMFYGTGFILHGIILINRKSVWIRYYFIMRLNFHEYHDMTPIVIGGKSSSCRALAGSEVEGMLLAQGKILFRVLGMSPTCQATMATARPRVNAIYNI
jgi:hypothetical protein